MDPTSALGHAATAGLAHELQRCWKALGLTGCTVEDLLRRALFTAGRKTRRARQALFVGLVPNMRRGVDPKARTSLAAEGSGSAQRRPGSRELLAFHLP